MLVDGLPDASHAARADRADQLVPVRYDLETAHVLRMPVGRGRPETGPRARRREERLPPRACYCKVGFRTVWFEQVSNGSSHKAVNPPLRTLATRDGIDETPA
ncbi:hypothetical protein GCM10009830_36780 [Glycomyces endophyticus]|uniref:Uncharacterized protein n=1 Tax=Glycomyces endophyticus TaxID=480996 RepID=A0ABP4TCM8_9ACTN